MKQACLAGVAAIEVTLEAKRPVGDSSRASGKDSCPSHLVQPVSLMPGNMLEGFDVGAVAAALNADRLHPSACIKCGHPQGPATCYRPLNLF
jgi:hypothetical protein